MCVCGFRSRSLRSSRKKNKKKKKQLNNSRIKKKIIFYFLAFWLVRTQTRTQHRICNIFSARPANQNASAAKSSIRNLICSKLQKKIKRFFCCMMMLNAAEWTKQKNEKRGVVRERESLKSTKFQRKDSLF